MLLSMHWLARVDATTGHITNYWQERSGCPVLAGRSASPGSASSRGVDGFRHQTPFVAFVAPCDFPRRWRWGYVADGLDPCLCMLNKEDLLGSMGRGTCCSYTLLVLRRAS